MSGGVGKPFTAIVPFRFVQTSDGKYQVQVLIIMISRTGAVNRRGLIPFSSKVDSVSDVQFVNGKLQPLNQTTPIDTSFRMTGFYIGDSVIVKDIEARNLNSMIRESMKSMVAQMMKSVKFPDSLLKVGDSFTQTVPLTIPLGQLGQIGMTITTTYTLEKICKPTQKIRNAIKRFTIFSL